jgi:hypothetical protein
MIPATFSKMASNPVRKNRVALPATVIGRTQSPQAATFKR